jgi:hypothetical protein
MNQEETFSRINNLYTRNTHGVRHYFFDEKFYYVNGKFVGKVSVEQMKNIISYARGKHEIVYGANSFNVIVEGVKA